MGNKFADKLDVSSQQYLEPGYNTSHVLQVRLLYMIFTGALVCMV